MLYIRKTGTESPLKLTYSVNVNFSFFEVSHTGVLLGLHCSTHPVDDWQQYLRHVMVLLPVSVTDFVCKDAGPKSGYMNMKAWTNWLIYYSLKYHGIRLSEKSCDFRQVTSKVLEWKTVVFIHIHPVPTEDSGAVLPHPDWLFAAVIGRIMPT